MDVHSATRLKAIPASTLSYVYCNGGVRNCLREEWYTSPSVDPGLIIDQIQLQLFTKVLQRQRGRQQFGLATLCTVGFQAAMVQVTCYDQ